MIRRAAILALAGCTPGFVSPPDEPPAAPAAPTERIILTEDGAVRTEEDPFSPRALRRADHDVQATTIARGVALVVEPAEGAPIYVSNLLAAALVRRFAGHQSMEEAMAAPVVFLIRPSVASDAATADGKLVVDWTLKSEDGAPLGAVYATRRLTGAMQGVDPWTAVSAEDAEFIALQTAAHLMEVGAVRAALASGAAEAKTALVPTPPPRPITVVKQGSQPAPRFAPSPPRKRR